MFPMQTAQQDLPSAGAVTPFVISRTLDAPRDLVWKAFTEPARMNEWWGPKGFPVATSKMDFRPGGAYHYALAIPDGSLMWGRFVYREIVAPERIVLINSFSDEEGGLNRHPMIPTWPLELLSVFRFTEHDGRTTFTLEWAPLDATAEECEMFASGHVHMTQGWSGTLEQLEAHLARA
jgi:uncharacterized protein YndB with AHSA1/START domain